MIISEKQIMQLMQMAHIYLSAIDTLYMLNETLLTKCGFHNKESIAKILEDIANQQSPELMVIQEEEC
jgi:hypothetical protein